jgi:hypothetical protein
MLAGRIRPISGVTADSSNTAARTMTRYAARCWNRRNATSTAMIPSMTSLTVHGDVRAALTSSITWVSHAVRTVAIPRRTARSPRVMTPRTAGTDMPANRAAATAASSRYQRML